MIIEYKIAITLAIIIYLILVLIRCALGLRYNTKLLEYFRRPENADIRKYYMSWKALDFVFKNLHLWTFNQVVQHVVSKEK